MASPVSSLSLRDNLISKLLDEREVMELVYASDYGYNKVQQLTDLMNPAGSIRVENPKFEVAKLGNLSVAQTVGVASTLNGANLLVNFSAPNSNFRVKDIVADSNLIQGRVSRIISTTQIELEPVTIAWNVSNHFTAGMTAKRLFDASGNLGSRGKTSLVYTPELDFNYTGISRDTTVQYRRDRIKTYVKWEGKNWYTSQQELMMTSYAKMLEYKYYFSERKAGNGVEGDYNTTGGIRWNIINNGGKYFPISNNLTRQSFDDILYQFAMTVANNGRNVTALMGKQAMFNIQANVTQQSIQFAGQENTFGGMSVKGWNVMTYGIGGMTLDFVNYPLFDDPIMFPEISTITGLPKMSSSILLIDTTPVESADGTGMIPPMQKRYFGEKEFYHNFLPGMIGPNSDTATSIKNGDAILSVSDIDGVEMEIMSDCGLYIIPERMALIELAS